MYFRHGRFLSVLAAGLAALAVGAAPALAGEDDDGDDDDATAPAAPAQSESAGSAAGSSVPQGGVAAGAGGTAVQGPTPRCSGSPPGRSC
jgi:hypothetical protein